MPANAVVLDTNLLVLLVVGTASAGYIAKHKRLRADSEKDFAALKALLPAASRVIVTPNTATEASNLIGQTPEPARTHIYRVLRQFLQKADEIYVESKRAVEHGAFLRLGVTDSALLNTMAAGHTLLTSDLGLYLAAVRQGYHVVNFIHHIEAYR